MTSRIPYGEGWPWPKKDRVPGTVYRMYDGMHGDCMLIVAIDMDGTRRCVEVDNRLWCAVIRPREKFRDDNDHGTSLSGDEDRETLLQAPEAWTDKPVLPTEEALAWAYFRADPDTWAFLARITDDRVVLSPYEAEWKPTSHTVEMLRRIWARDENGLTTRARNRALEMRVYLEEDAAQTGGADGKR